ncbi:hypothetical protein BBP40_000507 [Aspergillus hancockii]|nr:hypothetical protein BBP40_000507 [Aspergillus hancockii]
MTDVCGSTSLLSRQFADAVRENVMSYMAQFPDINAAHMLILLSLYDWGESNGFQAWVYTGMATRMAQSMYTRMRANVKDACADSTQREVITRTVWACFVLDCMLRCGRYGPQSPEIEVLEIPLPMSEDDFEFGIESALRPSSLARSQELFEAASYITQLMQDLELRGVQFQTPFTAFCMFSAASALSYADTWPYMAPGLESAKEKYMWSFNWLQKASGKWKIAQRWYEMLTDLSGIFTRLKTDGQHFPHIGREEFQDLHDSMHRLAEPGSSTVSALAALSQETLPDTGAHRQSHAGIMNGGIGPVPQLLYTRDTVERQEIQDISKTGLNLGATTVAESLFAEKIRQRIPSIEQLRFCNSGTEANLYALSIARRTTRLSKVIVFNGGYHGGVLSFAHGVADNNVDRRDWILGKYNDTEGVQTLISENRGIAAAVLVEGMQVAGGCIPGTAKFLHAIQAATKENDMIFILDEVMTSRLAPGGLQSIVLSPDDNTPIKPDITTLGKWIAGGTTIGVFGGRRDLLSLYDPRSVSDASGKRIQMNHSGTFNNNTLAMDVGLVALSTVYTAEACTALNNLGDWFRQGLQDLCRGTRMTVTGIGSVCNIHFTFCAKAEITCVEDLKVETNSVEATLKDLFWYYAIQNGYWITRRGMLSLILGTRKAELQGFLDMVGVFVKGHHKFLR